MFHTIILQLMLNILSKVTMPSHPLYVHTMLTPTLVKGKETPMVIQTQLKYSNHIYKYKINYLCKIMHNC